MSGTAPATAEVVTVAWLRGLGYASAGHHLPEDNSSWATSGFLVVPTGPVGGDRDMYTTAERPVVQVDAYAVALNSGKPPWNKAGVLAQRVVRATDDEQLVRVRPTLPAAYAPVDVLGAFLIGPPPRAIPGDASSYAKYTFNLALHWAQL